MKRVISIFVAIIILSAFSVPFAAAVDGQKVVDTAGSMTSDEVISLTDKLETVSKNAGIDVVVVTIPTLESGTMMEYADDYYDYHGYSDDGCLLLVATEDRQWWLSTKGYGITALTDYGIDYIGEEIKPELGDKEWYDAFVKYADLVDEFVKEARNGKPFDTNHERRALKDDLIAVAISLGIGLVVAIIAVLSLRSKYKPVRLKAEANDYLVPGSLQLRESYDHFLYTHVSRTERSDNDSGGGSSTHTSSSGSTHGGGGGSF